VGPSGWNCSGPSHLTGLSSTLRTVIILITTHAAQGTGYLATSSSCYIGINEVRICPYVFEPISCLVTVGIPSGHKTDLGCYLHT